MRGGLEGRSVMRRFAAEEGSGMVGHRGVRALLMKRLPVVAVAVAVLMLSTAAAVAEEAAGDGPPLPLHTIEGVGGIVLTPTAYLVNPGPPGTKVGKPAFATHFALIGDKDFEAFSVTWTLLERIELGYAFNRLGLDDLDDDILAATGISISANEVYLHHLNLRVNVIRENAGDTNWVPAVTLGAHYKYNDSIRDIDRDLAGTLTTLGLDDHDGIDFTLTASKTLTCLPRPVIVSAGARASKAVQLGLLGFTDDYAVTFEGNLLVLVTDRCAVGCEYRQKRGGMSAIPGLIAKEDSWWDVHAAYIINNNMDIYATIGSAGDVANHSNELIYGLVFKYEF
jgi:hypothetical protein